ncbi:MAG: hypothetical protein WBV22_10510 [Anaerolineaceae bacterium]
MINADGDLPRHIATGRLILETGKVPVTEPFAYPYLGKPYVPHEWLFGVIYYLIYQALGLDGIVVISALLIAATFFLLYGFLSKRYNLHLPIFCLIFWGAAASSLHWIARPHLFTMLFLAVWLIWIDRLRRGEHVHLWKFLLLMLLWCNIHAEFIIGVLISLAYLLGWVWEYLMDRNSVLSETGKTLSIVLVTSSLVTLINPAGIQPWLRVSNYLGNDYLMTVINETNSPEFHQAKLLVLLGLIILSLILLALNSRKIPKAFIILISGITAMMLLSARSVHLYGIVISFVLAGTLTSLKENALLKRLESVLVRVGSQLTRYFVVVVTVLICSVVIVLGNVYPLYQFDRLKFPVDATIWLNSHPQSGNVFNDFNWGGYLILSRWPDQKVFIDSMSDHTGILTREYARVVTLSSGWQEVFDRYQITWVVMPDDSPLVLALKNESNWINVYTDETAVILVRSIK